MSWKCKLFGHRVTKASEVNWETHLYYSVRCGRCHRRGIPHGDWRGHYHYTWIYWQPAVKLPKAVVRR